MDLVKSNAYKFQVGRTFGAPQWFDPKQVIEFNETYSYTQLDSNSLSQTYNTINFGGYGAWHQMANRPRYWLAWQAIAMISDLMF